MRNIDIGTKYLVIDNLNYETLVKIFSTDVLYETNNIIVRQKKFSTEEIETALAEHTKLLANVWSLNEEDCPEGCTLNHRGEIIDLLAEMLGDDYSSEEYTTAIQETLLFKQMQLDGMRRNIYNSANNKRSRYFNPDAIIDVQFI